MKAILLAAGKGTRISRMVQNVPKSTLPINGIPLIRHSVQLLADEGIETIVCTGYEREMIVDALEGMTVKYYNNPFYDVTNSIASLWFAREEINDDMLILNADVYFSKDLLHQILNDDRPAVMAIDTSRVEVGDYFFKTVDGCIKKYGKDLPLSERSCEYVGIAKIKKSFTSQFVQQMKTLINSQNHGLWWENVLYSLTETKEINVLDVNGLFWSEIDYFDDYERILNYVGDELVKS